MLLVVSFVVTATNLHATAWDLAPSLGEDFDLSELRERYPAIENAEDLQDLLKDLTHSKPFLSLEAYYDKGRWLITGEEAAYVKDITINLITRKLNSPLEVVRQKYLGKVDSVAIRRKVIESILEILRSSGYTNASIRFHSQREDEGLAYVINIDEDEACLISQVNLPFDLPLDTQIELKAGDICDVEQVTKVVDELEDNLRAQGYREISINFDDFHYSRNKKYAEVNVSGSLGRRVVYKIYDRNSTYLVDELFADNDFSGSDLNIASPEVMKGELRKYYFSKGYEDVRINGPKAQTMADNTIAYTYQVDPGPQYLITNVQFERNTVFSREKLLQAMGLYNFWNSQVIFNRDEVNEGIDRLLSLYQEHGYWDISIASPRITKDASTASVVAVITVKEGKPRVLDELNFYKSTVFTAEELAENLALTKNDYLTKSALIGLEEKLKDQYIRIGYSYCEVGIRIQSREELRDIPTRVNVTINEGQRVRVGKISIVGLIKTSPEVVRRELLFKTGDWYNPQTITDSRSALMSLGIFRSVQISPADRIAYLDRERVLDLLVEVYEGKAGNIAFGPGYNITRGLNFTTEFAYNNLGGSGRQMSLKAALSAERNQSAISRPDSHLGKIFLGRKVGVGYIEPYLFGWPVNGNINITHKGTADEIWQLNNTLDVSLVYKPRDILAGSLVIPFYNLQLNRDEGTQQQVDGLIATGDTRIARIGLRFRWDRRDEVSWPTAGYLVSTETSWARYSFGGEYRFFKWDIAYNFYHTLPGNLVWANSLALTSFENVQRRSASKAAMLPSSDRLIAGGTNRVRGFQQQLGPYVSSPTGNEPIGGTKRTILKSELRYKISDDKGLACFIDSGNTFFSAKEVQEFRERYEATRYGPDRSTIEDNIGYEFQDLLLNPGFLYSRHFLAYGASFNLITPIGPIYLALAWPLRQPKSERCSKNGVCYSRAKQASNWLMRGVFDLSIGTEF